MNLLLYLLEKQKALKGSSAAVAGSLQWRINLAVRAVLAKAVAQVPAGTELSTHLNELRDSFDAGHQTRQRGGTMATAKPKTAKKAAPPNDESRALVARDAKRGIKFDVEQAVKLYKNGKTISEIAQAMGFPKGKGNNRTHAALVKAGARKARESEK